MSTDPYLCAEQRSKRPGRIPSRALDISSFQRLAIDPFAHLENQRELLHDITVSEIGFVADGWDSSSFGWAPFDPAGCSVWMAQGSRTLAVH